MTSEKEDFYKILRSKMGEQDIPAPEEDWRKMREMIDESRGKQRRLLWISISLVLLLGGVVAYFVGFNSGSSLKVAKTDANSLVTQDAIPVGGNNTSTATSKGNNTATREKLNEKNAVVETNKNNNAANPSIAIKSKRDVSKESNPGKSHVYKVSAYNKNHDLTTVAATYKPGLVHRDNKKADNSVIVANADIMGKTNKESQSGIKIKSAATNGIKQTSTSVSAAENGKVEDESSYGTKARNKPVTDTGATQVAIDNNATSAKVVVSTGAKNDSSIQNQVAESAQLQSNKSDSSNKKSDSSAQKQFSQAALPPLQSKEHGDNGFYIDAGAGFSLGWNYGGVTEGRGINPSLGLSYRQAVSDKVSFKIGAAITTITGMGTVPFINKHETYDFVYNALDTSLATKWLIYAKVPVQLEYKIGDRTAIGIGASISYLLNGWGQVNVYKVSGATTTNIASYNQFMYVKGYSQWNSEVWLIYRRTLFSRLFMYLGPYYGFNNIKNNSFFNQNKSEKDYGVKIQFSYRIF